MNGILAATLMVGGTGLLIGILLGIAGKKFYVEVDERETKVREALCKGLLLRRFCTGRRSEELRKRMSWFWKLCEGM